MACTLLCFFLFVKSRFMIITLSLLYFKSFKKSIKSLCRTVILNYAFSDFLTGTVVKIET